MNDRDKWNNDAINNFNNTGATPRLHPEMQAELEQFLAEARAYEASGEVWEEYTGDGE